jgi:hypothetical protein
VEEHAIAGVLSKERKSLQSTVVVTVCGLHSELWPGRDTTSKADWVDPLASLDAAREMASFACLAGFWG